MTNKQSSFKVITLLIPLLAVWAIFFLPSKIYAKKTISEFNIIFIGNSITQGVGLQQPITQAPPVCMVKYLINHNYTVKYINCGAGGSTTVDFLPVTRKLFSNVIQAADSLNKNGKPLIFSIMMGTNDSAEKGPNGAPLSPNQFHTNLLSIIDSLLIKYPGCYFILHQPIWYSPNTNNGSLYMAQGLARLQTYTPEIVSLAQIRKGKVFIGDRKAFKFFKHNYLQYLNPEKGNSGIFYLHPNVLGAKKLGEFWGKALINQIDHLK